MLFLLSETYNHIVFLLISRIFVPIMRRLLCSFLLFAWMSGISAQTTVKSADVVEKEDSMRVLSIIPRRQRQCTPPPLCALLCHKASAM